MDSIPKIFKGGEWIESIPENSSPPAENGSSQIGGEGVSGRTLENYGQTACVTVIGGQKYDPVALEEHLEVSGVPYLIVGAGRGAEVHAREWWQEFAQDDDRIYLLEPDTHLYGKNARKVNVEQVLCFAPESPLLLVGEGERVKQARAWLKRARWPREVIELP